MRKDEFLNSYIETALWSSTDDDGVPLDDSKYADAELADSARERMAQDCDEFQSKANALIDVLDDSVIRSIPMDHLAHDFWLTRNGHGAGFWDGDYPEPIATQLTALAHSFGECDLYIGDDGFIYEMPQRTAPYTRQTLRG